MLTMFSKAFFLRVVKSWDCVVKSLSNETTLTPYNTIPTLTTLGMKPFKNIVGKGENAGNQHFPLFPQCFIPFPKQISIFQPNLICCLQML